MTRMTRELSFVLLGAGMLTAAYAFWPEPDLEAKADEQAAARVGGHSHRTGLGHTLIWIHGGYGYSGGVSGGRPAAMANVSRGGFGATAGRIGGGGA